MLNIHWTNSFGYSWRHCLVCWLASWADLFASLITILTLGHFGAGWGLSIHSHGLNWREERERERAP